MHVRIDPTARTPVFEQLIEQIKLDVAQGALAPHAKLPTVRELAVELLLNPNTVQKAYNLLIQQGIAYSKKAVGVFIAGDTPSALRRSEQLGRARHLADRFLSECVHLGLSIPEILDLVKTRSRDFKRRDNP